MRLECVDHCRKIRRPRPFPVGTKSSNGYGSLMYCDGLKRREICALGDVPDYLRNSHSHTGLGPTIVSRASGSHLAAG